MTYRLEVYLSNVILGIKVIIKALYVENMEYVSSKQYCLHEMKRKEISCEALNTYLADDICFDAVCQWTVQRLAAW